MNTDNQSPVVIYESADTTVEVRLDTDQETVWLNLQQLADLFGRDKSVISRHLKNTFRDAELDREAVVAKNATTAADGKTYQVDYYNLEAIISVGFRVSSTRATRFRQWATRTLRQHLTQGWTLNRQRFETNARELEAAMALVRKAAQSPALDTTCGRGLVDIVTRYAQTFLLLQRYDEGLLTETRRRLRRKALAMVSDMRMVDCVVSAELTRGDVVEPGSAYEAILHKVRAINFGVEPSWIYGFAIWRSVICRCSASG